MLRKPLARKEARKWCVRCSSFTSILFTIENVMDLVSVAVRSFRNCHIVPQKEEEREMVDTLNRAYVSIHGHSFPQEKKDEAMNKMMNLVAQMSSSNADCSGKVWRQYIMYTIMFSCI